MGAHTVKYLVADVVVATCKDKNYAGLNLTTSRAFKLQFGGRWKAQKSCLLFLNTQNIATL